MLLNIEDELTPDQLMNISIGGTLTEEKFLTKVEHYVAKPTLSDEELDRLTEVVASRVFKLLTSSNPALVSSVPSGRIMERLLTHPNVTPGHLRMLVDGWCQEVLAPLQYLDSGMVDRFISVRLLPFATMARLAGRHDCPVPLLGRLWRMTRLVEGDLDESHSVLVELLENPAVPSAFALRLKHDAFPHLLREPGSLSGWDGYNRAQADYPDLADLPEKMFVEVLSSLPIPDAWFAEMREDFSQVIWVAPGIRR